MTISLRPKFTTARQMEKKQEEAKPPSLELQWVFGLNIGITGGVHYLADATRRALLYTCANIGIIYDLDTGRQRLLQAHRSVITCCAVSVDKRWIVTADSGEEAQLVVWDSATGLPVTILWRPHPRGVRALDISPDSKYIATLSVDTQPQQLCVWDWTSSTPSEPVRVQDVPTKDVQKHVRFNPSDLQSLVTNGDKRVIFWKADGAPPQRLRFFAPPLSARDFKHQIGQFTQTEFIPNSPKAVSATVDGDLLLWDEVGVPIGELRADDKKAAKAIREHTGPINVLATVRDYIVTGGDDGCVRFYDFQFRLVAWFEHFGAGPVIAVSFAHTPDGTYGLRAAADEFQGCPEFVVATRHGTVLAAVPDSFHDPVPDRQRGQVLLQFQSGPVYGLAAHPTLPRFASVGYSGRVQLWNYETKELLAERRFGKASGQCAAFDRKDGSLLAVGFTNGAVKLFNARDLTDVPSGTFRWSKDCITDICFSHDGRFLATADAERCVALFRKIPRATDSEEWEYVGRYRAHYKPITGLHFGVSIDNEPRLVSIGEDRVLAEYDVQQSSPLGGVVLKSAVRIEQQGIPTAVAWYPRYSREDMLVVANNLYKFRLLNSATKMCRRTLQGPTYGGPLNRLAVLDSSPCRYLAYATHERVIGLVRLPLDGNVRNAVGMIAHPAEVANMVASHDAHYLLTCGGSDFAVALWKVDYGHSPPAPAEENNIEPFVELIEGGREGEFWKEMEEYFYYAQIKSQGEDTTTDRQIGEYVHLDRVPDIVQALGFYASKAELQDMVNEIKFSRMVETGKQVEYVTIEEFVRTFVNHRPVFPIGQRHVEHAFKVLGADPKTGKLDRDALFMQLQQKGEPMTETELNECFEALLDGEFTHKLGTHLTADDFAHELLGFERV